MCEYFGIPKDVIVAISATVNILVILFVYISVKVNSRRAKKERKAGFV